jgi:hypothetical protein
VLQFEELFPVAVQPLTELIQLLIRIEEEKGETELLKELEKRVQTEKVENNKQIKISPTVTNVITDIKEIVYNFKNKRKAKVVLDSVCEWYKRRIEREGVQDGVLEDMLKKQHISINSDTENENEKVKLLIWRQQERKNQKSFLISLEGLRVKISMYVDKGDVETLEF